MTCDRVAAVGQALRCAFGEWSIETLGRDFLLNLAGGLLAGLFIALIASQWYVVRWYVTGDRRAFRRMFGRGVGRTRAILVVLDTFIDAKLVPPNVRAALNINIIPTGPSQAAGFVKVFPDNHATSFPMGDQPILAYASARAAGYVVESLASVPGISTRVVSDEEVAERWQETFVCIGNSYTNVRTDDLKHSTANEWLNEDGGKSPDLSVKDGQVIEHSQRRIVGYVWKVWNPHSRNHAAIVCADIGPWGSSGAAWFFARNWRTLSRRFRSNPFLLALAITPGSDEAVEEIAAWGREAAWRRFCAWLRDSLS